MVDFTLSTYYLQGAISFSVMLFCMVQLGRGQPSDVYLPVLTGTLGYWLPNPKSADTLKAESALEAITGAAASIKARKDASATSKAALAEKTEEVLELARSHTLARGAHPIASSV